MLAHLAMMAPRLVELRRVLKDTGSICLPCDPTASQFLTLLMDAVFGPQMVSSKLIWRRTSAHSSAKRWWRVYDTIFCFTKSENRLLNRTFET
jgi:site-specific DNA-methyltransferase (adenine-specific)